jgi:ABC-type multidrug transport system fused ATPase/permease subunit
MAKTLDSKNSSQSLDSQKETTISNTQYNAEPAIPISNDNTIKNSRMDVFKRLITFCKPEAPRICIGFIALGVNAATNLSFPYILGRAVDSASTKSDQSVYVLGQTAGIFLVGSLASWIRLYCLGTATDLAATRLRKQLFESYVDMNVEFFDASTSSTGELVSVLEKDVDAAAVALTDKLASGLRLCC